MRCWERTRTRTAPSFARCARTPTRCTWCASAGKATRWSRCTTRASSPGSCRARPPTTGSPCATASASTSSTTPTAGCRPSARSTCTSSAKVATSASGTSSAPTCARYDTPAGAVTGTSFAVWAPTRAGRAGHRRLRRLDRLGAPDARARQHRRVGAVRAGHRRGHPLQVPDPRRATAVGARRPTRWRSAPRSRPPRRPSSTPTTHEWGDDEWMAARAQRQPHAEPMSIYEVHLGLVAARAELPRDGRAARRLPRRDRLHPRRAAARGRAPVRRVVGLPGHVVLRPDRALRHARRLPLVRRPPAPARLSA